MDAVSYSHADKQKQRIEKFNANPDSNSGIVTVPKTIGAGESVTIPTGRVAVLPNVQVDGEIVVQGEVFIPAGSVITKDVVVLQAPDNSLWAIKVSNTGVLSTEVYNG